MMYLFFLNWNLEILYKILKFAPLKVAGIAYGLKLYFLLKSFMYNYECKL